MLTANPCGRVSQNSPVVRITGFPPSFGPRRNALLEGEEVKKVASKTVGAKVSLEEYEVFEREIEGFTKATVIRNFVKWIGETGFTSPKGIKQLLHDVGEETNYWINRAKAVERERDELKARLAKLTEDAIIA